MSSDTNFGTGYYLSSVGEGGGGLKLWQDSEGGPLKFVWKMKTRRGGSRKSSKVTRGDHFGEATFKGGIG